MRILILTQWYPPEPQKVLSDLAESLQALGHEVTVLTGLPNYPQGRLYPGYRVRPWQRETINGVPVVRVPLFPDHSRSALKRSLNFLSFCLAAAVIGPWVAPRVDVIHVIHPPLTVGLPAWVLSRLFRVPFTYEIQDMWPETLRVTGMVNSERLLALVGWFARWVYRRADAIRVISPGFRVNLIAKGVPASKVHVISNWVDTEYYKPVPPDDALAENLGLAGRFNVMYAGTLGLAQGLETVLDAAALLSDLPEVRFVLVGDGVDLPRLEELARARGLTNVRFLGRYPGEAMPPLYALADVLLIHLRDDPLFRITIPHKTFTYMASARPVLAAVEGDVADVVGAAGAGLSCRPSDPVALADLVRRFHAMPADERRWMGENGRRAACESFGREPLVGEIARLLQSTIDRRRAPAPLATPRPAEAVYRFYAHDGEAAVGPDGELPPGYAWSLWRPGLTRLTPPGQLLLPFGFWWLTHHLRVFPNPDYRVLVVTQGARVVHRSCVFPRYWKFPFMADDDLQIGDVWTDEAHRGKGVATFAMCKILSSLHKPGRRFWYVVGEDNAPSIRIPERAGFALVGTGRKWPRLGLGILGKYVPDAC